MKFTTAAVAASAAALVSAAPVDPVPEIKTGDVFRIMSLRSASPIHFGEMQAANSSFVINAPKQGAGCDEDVNYASFRLNQDGELSLNTRNPPQVAYVDRSGMGQGIFKYTTGVQGAPRNSERTGFTLDENNNLIFKDQTGQEIGFQACPNALNGGYSVWLDITKNPGGDTDCVPFSARALKEDKPVSCMYTS